MDILGAILLIVFLSLIAGMALCAGCDRHRKFDLDELAKFLPDAGTAQAAAIEQLAAFTAQFPQIVAQLGLGKRK